MNLPPTWSRMSWRNRAAYLVESHQARDFSHACAILGRRKKQRVVENNLVTSRTPLQWWQKD